MTREKFLTVRWNNMLSLGLGLPALVYILVALVTSLFSGSTGFLGMVVIGALY